MCYSNNWYQISFKGWWYLSSAANDLRLIKISSFLDLAVYRIYVYRMGQDLLQILSTNKTIKIYLFSSIRVRNTLRFYILGLWTFHRFEQFYSYFTMEPAYLNLAHLKTVKYNHFLLLRNYFNRKRDNERNLDIRGKFSNPSIFISFWHGWMKMFQWNRKILESNWFIFKSLTLKL